MGVAKPTGPVQLIVLLSFFFSSFGPKEVKTVPTNMVSYVVWAINLISDFTLDLQVCLRFEVTVASKPHFWLFPNLCVIYQSSSSHNEPIAPKFLKKSPKLLKNLSKTPNSHSKIKFSMSATGLLGPNLV